jgi:hypothetical protein
MLAAPLRADILRIDRKPAIPFRLVLVEWEDSARPISAWDWVDNYEIPETVSCVSVGYLIAEAETAIALAPNIGDFRRERLQASGILRVPRSAVRGIIDL